MYAGQEATVRTAHGTTDWFQIGKGVRQAVDCHPAYLTYVLMFLCTYVLMYSYSVLILILCMSTL